MVAIQAPNSDISISVCIYNMGPTGHKSHTHDNQQVMPYKIKLTFWIKFGTPLSMHTHTHIVSNEPYPWTTTDTAMNDFNLHFSLFLQIRLTNDVLSTFMA